MAAKRMQRRRTSPVAYQDGTIANERLPLPIVHYPGHYGAFIGFALDRESAPVLCSCSLDAIRNYLEYRVSDDSQNAYPEMQFIVSSKEFPLRLVRHLMDKSVPSDLRALDYFPFADHVCHQCNRATPSKRYCNEMYGGVFKQTYGWYIARKAFELGFHPVWGTLITQSCSDEVQDLAIPSLWSVSAARDKLLDRPEELAAFESLNANRQRRLWNIAENEVRIAFGHKRIGDAWTSETILYSIVRRLWPNEVLQRHARPTFLNGLELDVFLPNRGLGIEYQGIQHYESVAHWGGPEALEERKKRDQLKFRLCNSNNVRLVYFRYDENLSEPLVEARLRRFLRGSG